MLSPTDLNGNKVDNYAWKFFAKRKNIDMRRKLRNLQLNKDGVKVTESEEYQQPFPKIEIDPISLSVPPHISPIIN